MLDGETVSIYQLHDCKLSNFGSKDLGRYVTLFRPPEIDVFIHCRLKHLRNELILKSEEEEQDNELMGNSEQTRWNFEFVSRSKQKEHTNNLFRKSELTVENNELILKSEKKEQKNNLVGKSEQKEQNNKLFRECKQAEQNNKLILKSEQKVHNSELILECEQQEQNDKLIEGSEQIEQNEKLILKSEENNEHFDKLEEKEQSSKRFDKSEQKEQNNGHFGKWEQKEQNNELFDKSQEKEQNNELFDKSQEKEQNNELFDKSQEKEQNNELFDKSQQKERNSTYIRNSSGCRGSQNRTKPHKQSCRSRPCCWPLYFTQSPSVAYSFVWLKEYLVCGDNLLYDSKETGTKQQTSLLSDDQSRFAVELSIMVWLQLMANLSPVGESRVEETQGNAEEYCESLKSHMSLLVVNYMNNKFNSDCKNSKCVILGNVSLSDIKEKGLYLCEDMIEGNNTKVESSDDATFQRKYISHKEDVSFCPVHRSCFKMFQENNDGMKEPSRGHEKCVKYDIAIFVYMINMDAAYRSSDSCMKLYKRWGNVSALNDDIRLPAERRSPEVYSTEVLDGPCTLNTDGFNGVCIVDILNTGYRSSFTSSGKYKNFLEMLRSHRDDVCIQITRILFCAAYNENQVSVFCYIQNDTTLFRNVKLRNKNQQCKLLCHITSQGRTNKLLHRSECKMWKGKQLSKMRYNREDKKQNGYENQSLIRMLYKEMSQIDTEAIHKYIIATNHHNLFNSPENYCENSAKRYSVVSNVCFSDSKMSKCGNVRYKYFLKNTTTFHMPYSKPKQYLTSINTAKDVTAFIRTLNHLTLTSAKNDRTKAKLLMGTGSSILEGHKKSNIWIRMFRYTTNIFCQKTRSRHVKNDYMENTKVAIKSGLIKARQATMSSDSSGLNTNSSKSDISVKKEEKSKSQTTVTMVPDEDEDEESSDENSYDEEDEITAKSTRIKANIECMDNFLIIWHSGFLILFLFLLGVGVVLRVYFSTIIERSVKSSANYVLYSHFVKIENVPDKLEFGNLTEVLGESLIILSSIYIACVLCYMTFLIHRITFTIPLVVIVTGAVVLTEVNIINIYMSPVSAANEEAKKELTERANKEYAVDSNKPFSVTYDLISIWGHCCGIVDQYDFQNVMLKYFLPTKSEHKTLQVPPTCCQPSYFEKGVEDVVDCASTAEGIFNVGCYQTIYIWLRLYCNLYSIVVILQLLDLCIHIILYKKHLSLLTLEETHIQKLQQQASVD